MSWLRCESQAESLAHPVSSNWRIWEKLEFFGNRVQLRCKLESWQERGSE